MSSIGLKEGRNKVRDAAAGVQDVDASDGGDVVSLVQTLDQMEARLKKVRAALTESVTELLELQGAMKGAVPDQTLARVLEKLSTPDVNVVVCGEVTQGKTTFINALLGREVLPAGIETGMEPMLSVRLFKAPEEAAVLVRLDGSKRTLARDELIAYAKGEAMSLTGRDAGARIDLYVPDWPLPDNVQLTDTPGLGSLYPSDKLVLRRCVSEADAVVFVKSADMPFTATDRDFLKDVFCRVKNVQFVMTKTDQFDRETVEAIARHNETLLAHEFAAITGRHYRLWPVSSVNRLRARQEKEDVVREVLEQASGFAEVRRGFDDLISGAVNRMGVCAVCEEALRCVSNVSAFAEERRQILQLASDKGKQEALRLRRTEAQAECVRRWGPGGSGYAQLCSVMEKLEERACGQMRARLEPDGSLCQSFVAEIQELSGSEEDAFGRYASALLERALSMIRKEWEACGTDLLVRLLDTCRETVGAKDVIQIRSEFGGCYHLNAGWGSSTLSCLSGGIVSESALSLLSPTISRRLYLFAGIIADKECLPIRKPREHLIRWTTNVFEEYRRLFDSRDIWNDLRRKTEEVFQSRCEHEIERVKRETAELDLASKMSPEASGLELSELEEQMARIAAVQARLAAVQDELAAIDSGLNF